MLTDEEIYLEAVKKKRVFEDGYCWRCAEHPGGSDDLGLCGPCGPSCNCHSRRWPREEHSNRRGQDRGRR